MRCTCTNITMPNNTAIIGDIVHQLNQHLEADWGEHTDGSWTEGHLLKDHHTTRSTYVSRQGRDEEVMSNPSFYDILTMFFHCTNCLLQTSTWRYKVESGHQNFISNKSEPGNIWSCTRESPSVSLDGVQLSSVLVPCLHSCVCKCLQTAHRCLLLVYYLSPSTKWVLVPSVAVHMFEWQQRVKQRIQNKNT